MFMENKKLQGGKRRGAGRKPVLHKKKQYSFYIEGNKVIKFGNEDKMKEEVYRFVDNFGTVAENNPIMERSIQDLTQPTNQIKPITDIKTITNTVINTIPVTPLISPYNSFRERLKNAKYIKEVSDIMNEVRAEAMLPREKQQLEAYAKEVSKEMYTD